MKKSFSRIVLPFVVALGLLPTARAGGLLSMEPGPVDFSGGFDGRASDDGRVLQLVTPGSHPWFVNTFFSPDQYKVDCETPYVLSRAEMTKNDDTQIHEYRVCRIVQAPIVTTEFLDGLKSRGFRYSLSFSYANGHSQRGLIFWTSGGAEQGRPPGQQGFARIQGVEWRDQYQPAARCVDTEGKCSFRYFEHGDAFGAFIRRFPSPDRDNAARVFQEVGFDPLHREAVTGATIVIDRWLGTPSAHQSPTSTCEMDTKNSPTESDRPPCSLAKSLTR